MVPRPAGLPKKGWRNFGRSDIECSGCSCHLGVISHPGSDAIVLICDQCNTGWTIDLYDEATREFVNSFMLNQAPADGVARPMVPRVEVVFEDEPSYGPGRIPTGDGPRSRPLRGIARTGF
jgi:hypothetical protein